MHVHFGPVVCKLASQDCSCISDLRTHALMVAGASDISCRSANSPAAIGVEASFLSTLSQSTVIDGHQPSQGVVDYLDSAEAQHPASNCMSFAPSDIEDRIVTHLYINRDFCIATHFCIRCDFCIVTYLYINCDFSSDSHFRIVSHMERLAHLTAMTILLTGGLGLADMTIASPAHAQVGSYATHGHGGSGCMACRVVKHR